MTISIIIPVYNSRKYIKKCINSVINQSYSNFEIIVVDDGSTDGSLDIIYSFNDSRIKVIKQENRGVSEARNVGIKNSSGDYIMFIDSDDYIEFNMLEKFVNVYKNFTPDLIICGIFSETCKNSHKDMFFDGNSYYRDKTSVRKSMVRLYEKNLLYNVWNKMFKLSIIKRYNITFPSITFGEDNTFNQSYLLHCNSIYNISDCLYHYVREVKNSVTTMYIDGLFNIRIKENKSFINFFKKIGIPYRDYCNFVTKHFIERTIGCLENIHRKNNLSIIEKYNMTGIVIHSNETKKYLKMYDTKNFKISFILYTYNFNSPFFSFIIGYLLHFFKSIAPDFFNKVKNKR